MNDREKVIGHLYDCLAASRPENMWVFVRKDIIGDSIALLKGHEAVEPKQVDVHGEDEWWGLSCACPDCKTEWMSDKDATHFCPNCGRPVKWE